MRAAGDRGPRVGADPRMIENQSMNDNTPNIDWRSRCLDLEDILVRSFQGFADTLETQSQPNSGDGVADIWIEFTGRSTVLATALAKGPVQEFSFEVQRGNQLVHRRDFEVANCLEFQAPVLGTYVVTCRSRVLGQERVLGTRSVEVVVS